MRIAFLGKGGSGKTTTAAGFARFAATRYPFVLALDADVNAHLKAALAVEGDTMHLEEHYDEIIRYLRGDRVDLGDRIMLATTPPSSQSKFIRVSAEDELIKRYALQAGSLALLTVGQYRPADLGGSCYHTKLFGLAAILHHMLDGPTDIVVADTTAGTDNLATSLWFAYDMNVFVVEPTAKSLSVYNDFIGVSEDLAEKTFVVGNKVDGDEDDAFIRGSVKDGRYLGSIPLSRHLKRFEQGKPGALEEFRREQEKAFDAVLQALLQRKRDWAAYLQRLRDTHTRICSEWFNGFHGVTLDDRLDADFAYENMTQPVAVVSSQVASLDADASGDPATHEASLVTGDAVSSDITSSNNPTAVAGSADLVGDTTSGAGPQS